MILDTVRYQTKSDYAVHDVREWQEVEELVQQLDGDRRTDLMVFSTKEGSNREIIVMGGGEYYYVKALIAGVVYLQERPDQPKDEYVRIVLGGDSMSVSKALTVSLSEALQATKTFCLQGELDPALHWEKRTGLTY